MLPGLWISEMLNGLLWRVPKGARNNFLEIIATPAEYFTAESFGQHEDEGSCVVPRDHINIRVSGIEVHSVQVVMVDLLKAGREVMKAQAKGLKENTNLSGKP